jgi:hypothetical protein
MAFVRGDRVGLIRLQRVLPNIFKAFPGCDPYAVLIECKLLPTGASDGAPTFYFRPERDGEHMVQPRARYPAVVEPSSKEEENRIIVFRKGQSSEELMQAYSVVTSSWRS